MNARRPAFPLVPRRRYIGVQAGGWRSARRGEGDEVAGSRPYKPGDHISAIDWAASARLSAAHGADEFVVSEYFAEQAPRVALVVDRSPALAIYGSPFPWLDKAEAVRVSAELVGASAAAARTTLVVASEHRVERLRRGAPATDGRFDGSADALVHSLVALLRRRTLLPAGSFVFVVSDFLRPVEPRLWLALQAQRWDVTPVVVQDPTWERSFPDASGVAIRFAAPGGARPQEAWLSRRTARSRRIEHERRFATLLAGFRARGDDPVVVETSEPEEVLGRFRLWAERRRRLRGRAA